VTVGGKGLPMNVSSCRLIRFVETLVKEASKLPEYSSKFSRKDYTIRQHVVLLCLKVKLKQRYREFCDLLQTMTVVQELLDLDKVPHWTTLDKVFLKLKNSVLMTLLVAESSGYACIDATGFDRRHASKQYLNRCNMHIKSLKATFLIDHNQDILDIHYTTTRKHDSKIVLPMTEKHRLRVLCADMGYDDKKVRYALRERGVRPLIPYRAFKQKHKYWNSLMDKKLYHKRSLVETVNSVIKRKYSDVLYSKSWRNQGKELTLLAVVYNIDRKIKIMLEVFYRA
jgi:IS5 family transposase